MAQIILKPAPQNILVYNEILKAIYLFLKIFFLSRKQILFLPLLDESVYCLASWFKIQDLWNSNWFVNVQMHFHLPLATIKIKMLLKNDGLRGKKCRLGNS